MWTLLSWMDTLCLKYSKYITETQRMLPLKYQVAAGTACIRCDSGFNTYAYGIRQVGELWL